MTINIIDEIENKVQEKVLHKKIDRIKEPYSVTNMENTLQQSINQMEFDHDRKRDETIDTIEQEVPEELNMSQRAYRKMI